MMVTVSAYECQDSQFPSITVRCSEDLAIAVMGDLMKQGWNHFSIR